MLLLLLLQPLQLIYREMWRFPFLPKTSTTTPTLWSLVLFIAFIELSGRASCGHFGINYGKVANDLLAPAEVVNLIQSIPMTRARIYDPDPLVLKTFRNTDISFLVGVPNEDLVNLTSLGFATTWIEDNILAYYPVTNVIGIVVGNEIYGGSDAALVPYVLPAMKNIYSVLASHGVQRKIVISTTHSFAVLSSSYPPSTGAFVADIVDSFIKPILEFLLEIGSPFMINAYPFFAYKDNSNEISLQYVLFQTNSGLVDDNTGYRYYNMFDAQMDAVYSAMNALGYGNVSVLVSETGWPSAGDPKENGASPENAQLYHNNLYRHLLSNPGTPLRPNRSIDVYIFALFNENLKTGPSSENHYGLFLPDGSKVYNFSFSTTSSSVRTHYEAVWTRIGWACMILVVSILTI